MTENVNADDVPKYSDLLNPTLTALHALGSSALNREINNQVIEDMGLSSAITQIPHGRGYDTELEYRLAWARTYLKKYGLIDNSERSVWSLTARGRETQRVEPKEVVRFVNQQNQARKQAKNGKDALAEETKNNTEEDALTEKVGDSVEDSVDDIAAWREDLLDTLRNIPPDAFERLCQRLLRESGFIEVEVTKRSGDDGIDGHGIIRLAGLISFPVLFQCKRYSGSVGASVVRDFRGAMMGRAEKGVILTTGGFTREAQREATRDGVPLIDLIDSELLVDKIKELELGVSVRKKMVEVVEVDRDWFASI